MTKKQQNRFIALAIAILSISIYGCLSTGKTPYYIEQYILDYTIPKIELGKTIDTSVKLERFSVAHIYNNTKMNYKKNPFKVDSYHYSRWRTNPGDLVGDYLLRDMKSSNIIKVVISYRNPEDTRFSIEGGIEEFLEVFEEERPFAVLSLNIAVLDNNETEITKKIIFQKRYKAKEPLMEHGPESLAKGMSATLAKISELFLKDLYSALKKMNIDNK